MLFNGFMATFCQSLRTFCVNTTRTRRRHLCRWIPWTKLVSVRSLHFDAAQMIELSLLTYEADLATERERQLTTKKRANRFPVLILPLCHWSSQQLHLRAPSSTDVPVLLLNKPIYRSKPTFYCLQPNESSHRSCMQFCVTHCGLQPPVTQVHQNVT